MNKIVKTSLLLSIFISLPAIAQTTETTKASFTRLDKIIAVVNREVITQSQFDQEMDRAVKQLQKTNQALPEPQKLRKEVLDHLIDKNLQMQLCKNKGIRVSDEDVNKAIQTIATGNRISIEKLKEAVTQTGVSYDEYKKQIQEQLLLQKIQQEEVAKTISFSEADVKKFMRDNKDKLNQYSSYHVVDIVFPCEEGAKNAEQIKKQANDLSMQLQKENNLDVALKNYPYAEKNDLGWRQLPEMPSLFQAKIASLKINGATTPVPAPNGFHILKLVEAKGQGMTLTEKDAKNLAFQQKVTEAIKEWSKTLRKDAYIKIN